jgi:hypothetical protein
MALLAAVILIGQALVSHLWLSRHRYGPAEYVWRWITWWHRPTATQPPTAAQPPTATQPLTATEPPTQQSTATQPPAGPQPRAGALD